MEKNIFKNFLNEKIYKMARLNLSDRLKKTKQTDIDQILENIDINEPTFKDLNEAKAFLRASPQAIKEEVQKLSSKKKSKTKKRDHNWTLYLIISLSLVLAWKYKLLTFF